MRYCIGCEEEKDVRSFYRDKDSCCKDCTNEYQRERCKKNKEAKQSDDVVVRIFDKLFEDRTSKEVSNEVILQKLEDIDNKLECIYDKLDKITLGESNPKKEFVRK
jgi:hypothetical protein